MSEWQPIATAPKDIPILVYSKEGCTQWEGGQIWVCQHWRGGIWKEAGGECYSMCIPTHWMPLPEPPQE